jgi:polyisoprenoid-binding protein YceI
VTNASFDAPTTMLADITGDYTLDPTHTRLGFSVRHAMVTTVRGQFTAFTGSAHIDAATPANSSVSLTIQAGSVETGAADRDGHLKAGDFFDVENHPEITFASTAVDRDAAGTWTITGDLTIKGDAKPLVLTFDELGSSHDVFGFDRVGFEGAGVLSRSDWGLTYNAALETGGVLISDKVKLDFDVSAIKS